MTSSARQCVFFLASSLGFLITGCATTSLYTRAQPKMADVAGTWVISPASRDEMKAAGSPQVPNQQIVLRRDGTFSMHNMPSFLFGNYGPKLLSDQGTWDLNKDECDADDCWWGIALSSPKTGIQANLLGNHAPYSLEIQWAEDASFILNKKQAQAQK